MSDATKTVQDLGLPFPVLYDPSTQTPQAYMVYNLLGDRLATPSTFLVDQEGTIRWKYVGNSISHRPPIGELLRQLELIEG